jgi:hypothetical protein
MHMDHTGNTATAMTALWCMLYLAGCGISDSPETPAAPALPGVWHEREYSRALILDEQGAVMSAGRSCARLDNVFGTGVWDTMGSDLILTCVAGTLWWPGGTGLAEGESAVFGFETSDTSLTLTCAMGGRVCYVRSDTANGDTCAADTSLQLLFPRGGEQFDSGTLIRIQWRASERIGSVVVDFSSDGGETFWNIGGKAIVPADSTWMSWRVEPNDVPAGECFVRVFDYSNKELGFSSSGAFLIR